MIGTEEDNPSDQGRIPSSGSSASNPEKVVIGVPVESRSKRLELKYRRDHSGHLRTSHGIGQLLFAGVAISYGIVRIAKPFPVGYYYSASDLETVVVQTLASVVFLSALLIQLCGFLAAGKEWNSPIAYATFGYGVIVATVMLFATIMVIYWPHSECRGPVPCPHFTEDWASTLFTTSNILLGVLFFLEAATYMVLADETGIPHAPMATGCVAVLGGIFTCIYALVPIGMFLTAAASILAGIVWILYCQEDQ